jgi:hypothetical protein
MARNSRKKLVAFYEVVDAEGRDLTSVLDWDHFFTRLSREDTHARRHRMFGVHHWGKTYTYSESDHFVLARLREEGVSAFNIETDEIIDSETDIAKPWVEVSVASFIPGTNRFGFVLGSQAAPRASAVADWINEHKSFDGRISVKPLVNQDILRKLNGAAEARLLTVRLTRDQISSTQSSDGIFSAANALSNQHGDVEVELSIRVKGHADRDHQEERSSILESARRVVGSDFEKAVAQLINYNEEGRSETETVNFLNDRIAKKMNVKVTDDEGNPIKVQSAIDAIIQARSELRRELHPE